MGRGGARGEGRIEKKFGPGRAVRGCGGRRRSVGKFVTEIPKLLGQAERTADAFRPWPKEGLRLDDHTVERLAEAQSRHNRASRIGIWVAAIALALIALALLF